ncbi:MAG: hypothetical protein CL693_18270 [Cellvibrionaceae bacterium]|nr:hypothetical protein [Cellvibrionaceae bacterium]
MNDKFDLSNKVALVTGGAMGIGAAIVRGLCNLGATVVISDRNGEQGRAIADELVAKGAKAAFVSLDVTDENQWQQAIETVEQDFQRLDVLVNNAGILFHKTVDDTSLDDFKLMNSVNVEGVFLGCKHAARLMKKTATLTSRASIINISSVGGLQGMQNLSAYCTSKGAVRLMTKSIAAELGQQNIRVNSIHPGVVDTNMGKQVTEMIAQSLNVDTDAATAALHSMNPLQANAQPDDIAAAVAFLAADASNFMTGAELVVDGGTSNCQ